MKNRMQKWLLVAGCLVICAAMVGLIGSRFTKEPIPDDILPAADSAAGGVTVDAGTESGGSDATVPIVVKPDTSIPADNVGGNGAVYTGTEQTIQPDVTKPVYDEETLKDQTKTPDGEKVSEPPTHTDHSNVVPSTNTPAKPNEPQSGDKNDKGQIYVPGFGWINETGGSGETVGSDGDINKQVGIMGGD